MERSETIGALAAALAKAQGAMDAAKKDSTNPQFRSRYADFAAVVDAIRKPLSDNELAYSQIPSTTPDGAICVETILIHSSGEWIGGTLNMRPTAMKLGGVVVAIPADEITPHIIGSCLQYARRYGLQSIIGIPADDDDGNAASGHTDPKPQTPKPAAPKATTTAMPTAEPPKPPPAPKPTTPITEMPAWFRAQVAKQPELEWAQDVRQRACDAVWNTWKTAGLTDEEMQAALHALTGETVILDLTPGQLVVLQLVAGRTAAIRNLAALTMAQESNDPTE